MIYARHQLRRLRSLNQFAGDGVLFATVGERAAMRYHLIRESHHTDDDIETARKWLRRNYDVTGVIGIATINDEPFALSARDPASMTDTELKDESAALSIVFYAPDYALGDALPRRLAAIDPTNLLVVDSLDNQRRIAQIASAKRIAGNDGRGNVPRGGSAEARRTRSTAVCVSGKVAREDGDRASHGVKLDEMS